MHTITTFDDVCTSEAFRHVGVALLFISLVLEPLQFTRHNNHTQDVSSWVVFSFIVVHIHTW